MRREYNNWRKEGGSRDRYRDRKKEYRKLCEEKKRKEKENLEKEVGMVRTEGQVWKVINKERKKKKRIKDGIRIEE